MLRTCAEVRRPTLVVRCCAPAAGMAAVFWLGALLAPAVARGEGTSPHEYGRPEVMQFRDGKVAAFSMQFDDSTETQATFVIPELNKRHLVGTFFTNPGTDRYQKNREVWEVVCPQHGHELANHTMHHRGAADYKELDYEVGECARLIWRLYPKKSKIHPFLRGGGDNVKWDFTREEVYRVMEDYCLFWGIWPTDRVSCAEERGNGRAVVVAEKALKEHTWTQVGFHGIGGDWLTTSKEHFLELLDFLVGNRDQIHVDTTGNLHRYTQEFQAIRRVELRDASEAGFRVAIECDPDKVSTYGRPFTELYDEPLTVRVAVPDSWSSFVARQGADVAKHRTITVNGHRVAQFEVRPNLASAVVTKD